MKICVVSQQVKKTISGVGLHTNFLINSLIKDGHEVCVIAPEEQRPDQAVAYDFVPVPTHLRFLGNNQARWIPLSWNVAKAIRQQEQRQAFDLIHFTDARESLFYRGKHRAIGNINDTYSAELKPLGYYRSHYSDWLTRWVYYRVVHFLEGIALRKLNAVIANSRFTTRMIAEQYHVLQERLFTCYKAVDPKRFQQAAAERAGVERQPRVLFVGTNMQRKGLPTLIQAAPAILRDAPNTEFWVVGEDRVVPEMKLLCQKLGVDGAFHFAGWKSQTEILDLYAQSGVFVMPSLTEALGVVFLEAMAAGVPVVGTSVGGIPEIIQDRENGRLVEPACPEALASAVLEILRDAETAEKYRQAGLRTVERFSVEPMMACTYAIYAAVRGEPAGSA